MINELSLEEAKIRNKQLNKFSKIEEFVKHPMVCCEDESEKTKSFVKGYNACIKDLKKILK